MSQPDFQKMIRREIEDYLIEKCLVDPAFRRSLIENPRDALSGMGLPVSERSDIRVLVEEPGAFFIVLPRVLKETHEMDVEELEKISGGHGMPRSGPEEFFRGYV